MLTWTLLIEYKFTIGEIDWEHPGIYPGNLITCAGSERVTDRVCSIKDIRVPWVIGRLLYYHWNLNFPLNQIIFKIPAINIINTNCEWFFIKFLIVHI